MQQRLLQEKHFETHAVCSNNFISPALDSLISKSVDSGTK